MNKIKKYQAGASIALELAPYSYSNPVVTNIGSRVLPSVVKSIPTVLSTIAPYTTAAGGALGAGALMGGGLYLVGHAENPAVSSAINRAKENQAIRSQVRAAQEWEVKNNHYNSIINDGGLKLPNGSTVYKYNPTSGTAYLQKDIPNVGTGYWQQNMRTGELFDPSVINYNGITLPVTITGLKSGVVYNDTPVKSKEDAAGVGAGSKTPSLVDPEVPKDPENPENPEEDKRYRSRRKKNSTPKPEPEEDWDEFLRGWDNQGRPGKLRNPSLKQEWTRWPRTTYGAGWLARKFLTPTGLVSTGIGTYVLGRALGWWGDKENNDSKQNSNSTSNDDATSGFGK